MKKRHIITIVILFILPYLYQRIEEYDYNKTYSAIVPIYAEEFEGKDLTIEYGSKVDADSILKNNNAKFIGTSSDGETENYLYEINKTSKLGKEVKKIISVPFKIVDTNAPVIELKEKEVVIYKDTEYDAIENVAKAYDIIDGDLSVTVSHNIDFSTPGEYQATVSAIDKNNLRTDEEFVVKVVEKPIVMTSERVHGQPSTQSAEGWWAMGSVGAVRCGGYQAPLEYIDLYNDRQRQSVIDSGSAGYSYTGAGAEYIGDHASQGFSAVLGSNMLEIKRPDGSVDTFYKVSSHTSDPSSWIAYDGFDCWGSAEGRLMTQVCSPAGLVFTFWN